MRKGFTVVEVIVTFVILSILIFFAIYSFRFSIENVKKASYYLPKTAIAFSTMDRVLGGMYYYVIEKEHKEFVDFFNGDSSNINFITTSALFSNKISIARLSCGKQNLLYTEENLYHKSTNIFAPKLMDNAKTVVLFDHISSCHISYILKNGTIKSTLTNQIPQGVILKFNHKGEKYHLIFSVQSNFQYNKVLIHNEKYPI